MVPFLLEAVRWYQSFSVGCRIHIHPFPLSEAAATGTKRGASKRRRRYQKEPAKPSAVRICQSPTVRPPKKTGSLSDPGS